MRGIFRNLTIHITILSSIFLATAAYPAGPADCDDPNTYCISTIAELQDVTRHPDKQCYLMNDIETNAEELASLNGGRGFLPIGVTYESGAGTYTNTSFYGSFDGNGYTISGLVINANGSGYPAGLFGTVMPTDANVEITDLTLSNISVSGDYDAGALAGNVDMGVSTGGNVTISGCRVTGESSTVTGTDEGRPTGGLIGSIASYTSGSAVSIKDCANEGAVFGTIMVGGIVGKAECNMSEPEALSLARNTNTGAVTGSGDSVGGLAGSLSSGKVQDCFNTGAVAGQSNVGGLAGFVIGNITVEKCSNVGDVTARGNNAGGLIAYVNATRIYVDGVLTGHLIPTVTNCFARGTVRGANNVGGFVAILEGTVSYCYCAGHVFVSATVDPYFGGFCPSFTEAVDTPGATFTEDYFDMSLLFADHGTTDGIFEGISGILSENMNKASEYYSGDGSKNWDLNMVWAVEEVGDDFPYPFFRFKGGAGTPDDPYLIGDVYGLQGMGAQTLETASFKLISDVDASITPHWNDGQGFIPVGNVSSFNGTVGGQGFVIRDLFINNPEGRAMALFAALNSDAVVDSIILENATVIGAVGCGLLAGSCQGKLANCSVSGKVSGMTQIGGLAGAAQNAVIENCSGAVDVFGMYETGGLIGSAHDTDITNCHIRGKIYGNNICTGGCVGNMEGGAMTGCSAKGSVSGMLYVGGLIGSEGLDGERTAQISACASSAYVSGLQWVGGFAGLLSSSCERSLSSGVVRGDYNTGGFAGTLYGQVENCMSSVDVEGDTQAGGFAAFLSPPAAVTRCYSKGKVTGVESIGGFAGVNGTAGDGIMLSYWDMGSSDRNSSEGGLGLTSAAMKQSASFTTWEFGSIWAIIEGITRPCLQLPMTISDLAVTSESPATYIEDGGAFHLDVTVSNLGGQLVEQITLTPSFSVSVADIQYSEDDGETWQDADGAIGLAGSLAIGQSRTLQIKGLAHGGDEDQALAECMLDFEGIDQDTSNNTASLTWWMGPDHQGESDSSVVYGGDGGGCFIQSVNGR